MYKLKNNRYEAIVIGAGHAGVDIANALAVRAQNINPSLLLISIWHAIPILRHWKAHLVKEEVPG